MSSSYPGALDNLPTGIGPNTKENEEGLEHDVMHNRVNAAVNALQALLGTGTSAATVLARLSALESGSPGGGGEGGGVWWFDPPKAADFTLASGDGGALTVGDDDEVGLCLGNAAGTPGVIRYAYKAAPAANWSVTVRNIFQGQRTDVGGGLFAIESSSGRYAGLILFDYVNGGLQARLGTVAGGYTTDLKAEFRTAAFLRIERAGSNLLLSFSNDGKNFIVLLSFALTSAFNVQPDRIGLGCFTFSVPGALSCDHWNQSW